MGVLLAQAKNGHEQLSKQKFHAASQWKGSASTQSALIFFAFFICSQHVQFKFPIGSHRVLIIFPMFAICSPPRVFPIAPCFNLICFAQSPPLLTYVVGGPKGEALHLSIESSILGSLHSFNFFFAMGQSNWLIAKK